MPAIDTATELPDGATALIALARVAHREGNRRLEQAATEKLAREFGIAVSFPCCASVDKDVAAIGTKGKRNG